MKKLNSVIAAVVLGIVGSASIQANSQTHLHAVTTNLTNSGIGTRLAMRDLWLSHVFWVRTVAEETLNGNRQAASVAEASAVANAKAIAEAIEPLYGKTATDKLFSLLAGHYGAIKNYLAATQLGQTEKQDEARKALFVNADEIATFLSSANPNLPKDTVLGMLVAHGAHHIQQIQQLKALQYQAETKTWEEMKMHMYALADALTAGIAKQFPEKFQ